MGLPVSIVRAQYYYYKLSRYAPSSSAGVLAAWRSTECCRNVRGHILKYMHYQRNVCRLPWFIRKFSETFVAQPKRYHELSVANPMGNIEW